MNVKIYYQKLYFFHQIASRLHRKGHLKVISLIKKIFQMDFVETIALVSLVILKVISKHLITVLQ